MEMRVEEESQEMADYSHHRHAQGVVSFSQPVRMDTGLSQDVNSSGGYNVRALDSQVFFPLSTPKTGNIHINRSLRQMAPLWKSSHQSVLHASTVNTNQPQFSKGCAHPWISSSYHIGKTCSTARSDSVLWTSASVQCKAKSLFKLLARICVSSHLEKAE